MSKSHRRDGEPGAVEAADEPGVYYARHDPEGPSTVSGTVIRAVAEIAGVDPKTTKIPIDDSVDPDALDELFASSSDDASVRFEICGLAVVVRSDGTVRISNDGVSES
jgi:hypothetical protein